MTPISKLYEFYFNTEEILVATSFHSYLGPDTIYFVTAVTHLLQADRQLH